MKKNGISCGSCRKHFNDWVNDNLPDNYIKNKNDLFTYFWKIHNDVNKKLKREEIDLNEALKIYKEKNWNNYLNSYGVNILELFNNGELEKFPSLYNSKSYKIIREEVFGKIVSKSINIY